MTPEEYEEALAEAEKAQTYVVVDKKEAAPKVTAVQVVRESKARSRVAKENIRAEKGLKDAEEELEQVKRDLAEGRTPERVRVVEPRRVAAQAPKPSPTRKTLRKSVRRAIRAKAREIKQLRRELGESRLKAKADVTRIKAAISGARIDLRDLKTQKKAV